MKNITNSTDDFSRRMNVVQFSVKKTVCMFGFNIEFRDNGWGHLYDG